MSRVYDVIVIGSGFGGAITACRLAEKGMSVLILERGRQWTPRTYPRRPNDPWIFNADRPHRCNGWIDLRSFGRMTVALGAGVGGGSLCYSAVAVEAPPHIFEQGWPAEITLGELKPYYQRVGREMNVQVIPDNQLTQRFKLARDAARNLGHADRFQKAPLVMNFSKTWSDSLENAVAAGHSKEFVNSQGVRQGTCVHLGNCDIGCDVRAKNSLDFNYIPKAEKAGAELRTLHVARTLEPISKGRYKVHYDDIRDGRRKPGHVTGKRIVLAMGSIGSTEFLLRCRDQYGLLRQISHRLGANWSGNANFLSFAKYPRETDLRQSTGPAITGMIDFADGVFRGQSFAVEDDGFPNMLLAALKGKVGSEPGGERSRRRIERIETWLRQHSIASRIMVWLGSGADAGDGTLSLKRGGWGRRPPKLALDYPFETNAAVHDAAQAMHVELTRATGGRPLPNPLWNTLGRFISLHPLGGCGMGNSPQEGVVDHTGAVHRCPGLYVIDGAMLPVPTVLNPSHTIAALAERSADLMT